MGFFVFCFFFPFSRVLHVSLRLVPVPSLTVGVSWVYWGKVAVFRFACWCGFTTTSIHMAGSVFRVDGSSQTGPVCLKEEQIG